MTVRYVSAALVLGGLSLLPASFAMSAAQCQGLSKELTAMSGEMATLQTELKADRPALEDLQLKRNDAVEVRRFSAGHEEKAKALEVEYSTLKADYDERYTKLATMNQEFTQKRQAFMTECKAFLPKK